MIVSFDLDETLFVNPEKVPTDDPLKFPLCRIYKDIVYQNGIAHGFRVFFLKENDADWTDKLKTEIKRIRGKLHEN